MSKQSQPVAAQAAHKPQQKPTPAPVTEMSNGVAVAEVEAGRQGLVGGLSLQGQAGQLGDPRLRTIQRQRIAGQIGRVQGNHHLQRMVISLKRQDEQGAQPRHRISPTLPVTSRIESKFGLSEANPSQELQTENADIKFQTEPKRAGSQIAPDSVTNSTKEIANERSDKSTIGSESATKLQNVDAALVEQDQAKDTVASGDKSEGARSGEENITPSETPDRADLSTPGGSDQNKKATAFSEPPKNESGGEKQSTGAKQPSVDEFSDIGARGTVGQGIVPGGTAAVAAVTISSENPGTILQQLQEVPPVSAFAAYEQAQAASATALMNQKQAVEKSLPQIPAPTGLPAKTPTAKQKTTAILPLDHGSPEIAGGKSGRNTKKYPTEVIEAPAPPPIRVTKLAGDTNAQNGDAKLSQSAQTALDRVRINTSQIKTSAGERPSVDMSGEADASQVDSFQSDSTAKVQIAKQNASNQIYQDFGENNILPEASTETLKANRAISSPNAPIDQGGKAPILPDEAINGLNLAFGPELHRRVGEQRAKYDSGKVKYDADSAKARTDAEQQIAGLDQDTRVKQLEEQNKAKAQVAQSRLEWQTEVNQVEQDYGGKAQRATVEQKAKIAAQKQEGEEKANKHLADAEQKAAQEKQKAEQEAVRKKNEAKKESGGFWGWVQSKASALIDGLKTAINTIYDGLRAAVKIIFSAAKALVSAAIELARTAIVGLIKGLGVLLKGLVTVALAAFPNIAKRINSKIDTAVNSAVNAVNTAANALKEAATSVLDFLANTLDSFLGLIQSLYNGILTVIGMIIRGELKELMERLGNLVKAAKEMPSRFEAAAYEELLGGDFDKPLSPMELAQAGKTPPQAQVGQAAQSSSNGKGVTDAGPLPAAPWSTANVGVDAVENDMVLSPELISHLHAHTGGNGVVEFGESGDKERSMDAVMSEVTGQKKSGEEEQQEYPPDGLTPRERAKIRWDLMKQGLADWWSKNKVTIIAVSIAAIVGVTAAIIATGGAIFGAIAPLLSALGPLFVGLTVATLGGHIRDYVAKAWDGDIPGGAKSLAKGLAAGAIELLSWLTFKAAGGVIKGAKAVTKGLVKGVSKLAKGIVSIIARGAKFVIEKGKVLFKGLAKSGIGKRVKSLRELGDQLLLHLRFKKFRIRIQGRRFLLEGFINPWITIANGQITEVPEGTTGSKFVSESELSALKKAGLHKPTSGSNVLESLEQYEDTLRQNPHLIAKLDEIQLLQRVDPEKAAVQLDELRKRLHRLSGADSPGWSTYEGTSSANVSEEIIERGGREFGEKGFIDRAHHDIGVANGKQRAISDGLQPVEWHNPRGHIGGYGQGFDDIMRDGSGDLVIVEFKGNTSKLAKGQLSKDWVLKRIEQIRPSNPALADELSSAFKRGKLTSRVYRTPIDTDGNPLPTILDRVKSYPPGSANQRLKSISEIDKGLADRGYRPKPGERSMTRDEWRRFDPERRYKSGTRTDRPLGRDKNISAQNLTEGRRTIKSSDIASERIKFLGEGYYKAGHGKWRSLDGTRQFRVTPSDYLGKHPIGAPPGRSVPHIHFEFLKPRGAENFTVLKNIHVPLIR